MTFSWISWNCSGVPLPLIRTLYEIASYPGLMLAVFSKTPARPDT